MSNIGPWALMTAGIVGLVTAAGVLIYEHFIREKRRMILNQDILRLDDRITLLQEELRSVKKTCVNSNFGSPTCRKRRMRSTHSLTSEADSYISAAASNDSDEEFFDVSDTSDDIKFPTDQINKILFELDTQLDGNEHNVKRAHETLLDLNVEYPDTCAILWRLGKSYQKLYENTTVLEKKQTYISKGIEFCEKALKIDSSDSQANKWMAILIGSRANIQNGIKEKITDGNLFRCYLDRALEINPNDWSLYHLLGRFKYEVANLSWLERKAASTFFADPPEATYDEAIESLLKAEVLAPKLFKENRLFLAKCYIANMDYYKALDWLDRAKAVPALTKSDEAADVEIDNLLKKYNSYKL